MDPEKKVIKRPEKKETLAQKQEERIHRLNHLRGRLSTLPSEWWVKAGEAGGLVAIFLLNFLLLFPFFGSEDKANVFSAPFIPILAATTNSFLTYSFGVRLWLLVFFLFFPLSFYFLVREISGRRLTGFLSVLITSLPMGIFLTLRVKLGLLAQDGAHIASLTLTPLVCLLLLRFLRHGNFWAGIFSALGVALVALTSPIGLVVLLVFLGIVTFSEMLLGRGRLKMLRFLLVLVLAAGFSAFWYNPKFVILTIQSPQGQLIKKTLSNLLPISFFLLPLLGVFGFLLFENRPGLQSLFIAFFLTIGFGLFSIGAGVAHPTPSRFLPALGISLSLLLGIILTWFFDFLRFSSWVRRNLGKFKASSEFLGYFYISLLFSLILGLMIFYGRGLWFLSETKVLGAWIEDQSVGIWEIRQKTSSLEDLMGYGISGLTTLSVLILKFKLP